MSTKLLRAVVLALPLMVPSLSALGMEAGEGRWESVSYTPTHNDGLALTGAWLSGQQVLGSVAMPYFELNGVRYEMQERHRQGEPVVTRSGDDQVISARYQVPVQGGEAVLDLSITLQNSDAQYADLSRVSHQVHFSGPDGSWRFYWRIDPELRGSDGDQVQVFTPARARGYWSAPAVEREVSLTGTADFDRFQLRLQDGAGASDMTRLWLEQPENGSASAFLVRANDGEWEASPGRLLDGQPLQRITPEQPVAMPQVGSDLVIWYQASISGSAGEVGPVMQAANITGRTSVVEMDRMASTAFPPATVQHQGQTESMESAFAGGGVTLSKIFYDGTLADKSRVNMSELDAIMEASVTYQSNYDTPTQWFSWQGIAKTLDIPGVLGVMYDVTGYSSDTAFREGAFALYDSIVDVLPQLEASGYGTQNVNEYLLWTVTHETGHAYNQHHEDFWYDDTSCFYAYSAIMGYSYDCAGQLFWDFGPNSNGALANDPEEYVRPGHGVDFISSRPGPYPYNTTRAHRGGHHSTDQFSGGGCP